MRERSGLIPTPLLEGDGAHLASGESARRGRHLSTPVTVAILLLIAVGTTLVFWPGHMDADAVGQIQQARTGHFVDWWAPVLDAMWRVLFLLHLSPGFVLLASTTIFVFSAYELLRMVLPRGVAVVVTLLIVAFPPVLGFLGALQRETWFGASALASYALLARVHRNATLRPKLMAGLALLAVWVAMAARQTAVIAVLPAIVIALRTLYPGWRGAAEHATTRRSGRLSTACRGVIGVVGALIVLAGSQWIIKYPILGAERTDPQQATYYMDLANLSVREDKVLIPSYSFPAQNLAALKANSARYDWLPLVVGSNPPLKYTAAGRFPSLVTPHEFSTLQHDWMSAILHHPKGYLSERWTAWVHLIGWNAPSYVPYNPTYANNPWGYKALFASLNNAGTNYLKFFTVSPLEGDALFRAWPYLVVGVLVSIDLLRRRRPAPLRLIGVMSTFALLYYFSYFFLTNGAGYRYVWYIVGVTVIATIIDLTAHGQTFFAERSLSRGTLALSGRGDAKVVRPEPNGYR